MDALLMNHLQIRLHVYFHCVQGTDPTGAYTMGYLLQKYPDLSFSNAYNNTRYLGQTTPLIISRNLSRCTDVLLMHTALPWGGALHGHARTQNPRFMTSLSHLFQIKTPLNTCFLDLSPLPARSGLNGTLTGMKRQNIPGWRLSMPTIW